MTTIPPSGWFAQDYPMARTRFRKAAKEAGAVLRRFGGFSAAGRSGEDLSVDVAWLGPPRPRAAFVTVSGTHGVEGYCGSGLQIGLLKTGLTPPPGAAIVHIHALNPYGFSWNRRTTENNVDLNRNFFWGAPPDSHPGYAVLHPTLCPSEWTDESLIRWKRASAAFVAKNGFPEFQAAISTGQWEHQDGLFFGGRQPERSREILRTFFWEELREAEHIGLLDFHTGLGPRGHGELIASRRACPKRFARAKRWYGTVCDPSAGDSASADVLATMAENVPRFLTHANWTPVVLEFGTRPIETVLHALRLANCVQCGGDSTLEPSARARMRDAFFGDDAAWQSQVWNRAQAVVRAGLEGLRQDTHLGE